METPDEASVIRKSKHRKVKTGCLTCRKRRVKCDEGRPACQRCLQTGRICDGYGIWGGGGNVYGSSERAVFSAVSDMARLERKSVILGTHKTLVFSQAPGLAGRPESIGFEYFRLYTTTKLAGVFESGFWDRIVLQASAREPAVLHAVTAIGALHKDEERMALMEYNKAIVHLRKQLQRSDRDALRVALMVLIVFSCLELLRGGFKTGHTHLSTGLRLLREIRSRDGLTTSDGALVLRPHAQSVEDALIEAFARLNVQAALFGQVSSYLFHIGENAQSGLTYDIPSKLSFHDARQHLDVLINAVHTLTQQARKLAHNQCRVPDAMYQSRERLESALVQWLRAFDSSRIEIAKTTTLRTSFGLSLLRLYHTMTKIMAATSLRDTDEMIYDSCSQDFSLLLRQACELWATMARGVRDLQRTGDYSMPVISFTADMGFIPPLYYVALKCRLPNLRRMAIEMLISSPHREGAWEGSSVARMARHVMEMEEGGIYKDIDILHSYEVSDPSTAGSMDALPVVPCSKRFNDVNVALPASVGSKATLICEQYRGNGLWESKEAQFDVRFERHGVPHMWQAMS